jgi:hypothetical protein
MSSMAIESQPNDALYLITKYANAEEFGDFCQIQLDKPQEKGGQP